MPTVDTLRVAVVGAGVMGADHARLLAGGIAGVRVEYVADFDADRAAEVAAAYGARSGGDGFAAIADSNVDAIVVASPDATHHDLVLACLDAGKPVLCEKPLAATVAECEALVAAEEATGRRLVAVGFMRRCDPGYAALRAAVGSKSYGPPLMVRNVHRNASSRATSTEQQIISSPVHEFDVAAWLVGSPIASVQVIAGRASSLAASGVQDPLLLVCRTESGVLVDIELFANAQYGYDVRCELALERGTLSLVPPVVAATRATYQDALPVDADWRTRFADAYRIELQAWVDAVTGRSAYDDRLATARDGLISLQVAEAAIRSLHSEGAPIPL